MASEKEDPREKHIEHADRVVDDAQSPYNESQQQPGNSGDRRMPRTVGIPMPWGGQTDNLHPVDQPAGDVTDPSSERTPHREDKKRSA